MASYNGSAGQNDHLRDMLARLQQGRSTGSSGDDATSHNNPLSRFATLNQAAQSHGDYYGSGAPGHHSGQESPLMAGSEDFALPAAPTPPMNHFSHSHGPPGLNLGPIGTLPPSGNQPEQTVNLLSLLKYKNGGENGGATGGGSSQSSIHSLRTSQTAAPGPPSIDYDAAGHLPQAHIPTLHAPVPMPADPQGFLASLMKGDAHHESSRQEGQPTHAANKWNSAPGPTDDTQAYLLNLLQRKKPSQTDQPSTTESSQPAALTPPSTTHGSSRDLTRDLQGSESPDEVAAHVVPLPQSDNATPMSFPFLGHQNPASSPPSKTDYASPVSQNGLARKTMFDYKDPFDDLIDVPSPHNRTPKSVTSSHIGSGALPPSFQILKKAPSATSSPGGSESKHYAHESSAMASEHTSKSSRAQHNDSLDTQKETVSAAIENLAGVADEEAQEALARAEHEETQARMERELGDMMAAKSDDDETFERAKGIIARDLQQELEKPKNAGVLEDTLPPELARAVHDIIDEAANDQPIADSWESAEADEIVVIEEISSPVKVYNFPMKPWISISLQDNDEPRPQFRDEVILDIARVKKEFDQIDRNLVSATQTYIIYGMSKAGGLRVIRQDDGRDAKLFTDTKDRIFNVSVSSTPADLNSAHKESIIGTGISGTVYYTMIKNGDKDYLDDAHPEQYGFALPPVSAQEGDAPGGVLKTRARTSSAHPEYFAVGRGKTISIIWPSYIMQHNLFKPGHDRYVDTEKLSKQCSLRINTGKAGKDFTFSQDDTTIVSLDKSGRVKFWDVRDLTAADENSDPRFPTPAQTFLEVKEPLMTLTTTPENEKAWPTSVLLLDKQRPYQKRCALRYMIVGMKQNHTLQLWDLALGKPVQEFNLPHSKESDAVCSVMYHPPTGMIVVGHPTRNSIYFLHLSAPKYQIKGLSQVDFIQKLVAKDSSIPEPDSTAVISGVREYSFSNKGVIRSLDMLGHSAANSEDADEQTLFELYAMHSKGVSGICVKQHELGWTKDNKVVAPVDALDTGVVKISKLKELPSIQPAEVQPSEDVSTLPIRSAGRSAKDKENMQPTSGEDVARKTADEGSGAQNERKTAELPATPMNTEKAERRSRKKKDKAAAAAAERALAEAGASQPSQKNAETKPAPAAAHPSMSAESLQAAVKQVETTVANAIEQAMRENRQKVDSELRGRDVAFKKSQQNLLDVVSSALDNNVQRVLTATISDQVNQRVVPALEETLRQTVAEQISRTVSDQLDAKIGGRVSHAIQNQMQKLLPNSVGLALQKPELTRAISKQVSDGLEKDINKSFQQTLHESVIPAFSNMAVAAADKMILDIQKHAATQIEELEQKIRADSNKIDQLTTMVTRLSEMVNTMSRNQVEFQSRYEKSQEEALRERRQSQAHSRSHSHSHRQGAYPQQSHIQPQSSFGGSQASSRQPTYGSPLAHSGNQMVVHDTDPSKEPSLDRKLADLANQVDSGELEGALVRWLQSDRKDEIFNHLFSKLDPRMVRNVSPLVGLAVIAELSRDLNSRHLREKIMWMSSIVGGLSDSLPNIDSQVHEVVPNILGAFISQMETLYGRVSIQLPGGDPVLHHISTTVSNARSIIAVASRPKLPDY